MLQYLFKFLFELSDTIDEIIKTISLVGGFFAILGIASSRGTEISRKRICICILAVSIVVFLGMLFKKTLTEVPDVVGYTYQDACEILMKNNLKYPIISGKNLCIEEQDPIAGSIVPKNTAIQLVAVPIKNSVTMVEVPDVIGRTYQDACNVLSRVNLKYNLIIDNGIYVVGQDPVAGTFVEEGTMVYLSTEPIGSNPEVREKWENGLETEFGDFAIKFWEIMIQLSKEGMTIEHHGPQIIKYEVIKASLLDQTSGAEYLDYEIENDVMIFKHIPQGIEFHLTVLLSGYEEVNADIMLSSQNMIDNTFNLNYWMVSSKAELMLNTAFYIADGDNSTRSNVVYLNNVNLEIKWPYQTYWWAGYSTNSKGCLNQIISLNKEYALQVRVINPFGDGHDYESTVNLYPQKIGEAVDYDILFLYRDGNWESIRAGDYFLHSLKPGDTFTETQVGVTLQ